MSVWSLVRRSRWLRLSISAAAVLALTGCAATSAAEDEEYTIGLITSQTGPGSQLGVGELNGAQLAVKEINDAGGVNGHQLRLVTADDQSSPSQAVLQARKMLGRVDAIAGPSLSGPCKAIEPLATGGHVVDYCLSPGIKPAPGGYQWSASAATADLAAKLIAYWKSQGITRIGLLSTTDSSGVDGAESVEKAIAATPGTSLATAATFTPDAVSVISQMQQIAAAKPQALVVWSTGAGAGVAFQGMKQAGLDIPAATTNGNLTFNFVQRIKAFLPDPLLVPATRDFWAPSTYPDEATRTLEDTYHQGYRAGYGGRPDFGPGVAYDAVMLLAKALGQSGGDAEGAQAALQGLHDVPGVLGTYSFSPADHRGLTSKDVGIVKATADGFTYVGGGDE